MTLPKRSCMKVTGLALACSSLLFSCAPKEVPQVNLIPKPVHIEVTGGYFKVDSNLIFGNDQSGTIRYVVDESFNGGNPEGYALDVTEKGIELRAASKSGLFYGEQTLRQLYTSKGIPCVSIQDNPRFPYRGLHLDVSRHFFPKEEVMKLLNVMSYYKLNTLHMHLTDAGGWRIQMDKYPKLTTDVAFRTESDWQKWWDGKDRKYLPEGTPGAYGGYFTKEDIREIVDYATARHINIIPEIEFPGHSDEVFVAYPELSCAGKPYTTGDFCIGNEKSFTFMEDVLSEVIELFPSEYIHIGGDEAGKGAWKTCPKCQGLMRRNGMKDVDELQSYMIHRAEEFLISKGRKLIGWDEILEGKPDSTATIMSWRGDAGGISAALSGHDAIMSPGPNGLYLDYYQGDSKIEPIAIGGCSTLEKVYNYNPVPDTLVLIGKDHHIIGVQANNWSEYFYNNDIREYHMYPRSLALAEVAWTDAKRKNYVDFERRINNAYVRLDGHGVNYHIPLPEQPGCSCDHIAFTDSVSLEFTTSRPISLVYTLDGTEPGVSSEIYTSPLSFYQNGILKIASLLSSGKLSKVRTIQIEKQVLLPAVDVEGSFHGLNMEVTYGMFLNMQEFMKTGKSVDVSTDIRETGELTSLVPSTNSMRDVRQYAAVATGFIDIPENGVYFFSSDLEEVWVGGKLLVNNGGEVKRHSRNDRSIALEKGMHELKLVFLGHIIGGWPSNWNNGVVMLRKSDEKKFRKITSDMLWRKK